MTKIDVCMYPAHTNGPRSTSAMVKAGWQWIRSRYRYAVAPQSRSMLLAAGSGHTSQTAIGRAAVVRVPAKPSTDEIKTVLRKHQPTVGELPEKDCAICGENFPCSDFKKAKAELASVSGARPPHIEEPEEALTVLVRSQFTDKNNSALSETPLRRWQAICHRIVMIVFRRSCSYDWESWGEGAIRLAVPGARCEKCGKSSGFEPQIIFEIRFGGSADQILCWSHLLNPTTNVEAVSETQA